MAEAFIVDFSGGLNLSPPEDLLQPNESLRAENVVFDEIGVVGSGGARTRQNSTAYNSGADIHTIALTPTRNLYGTGTDVFAGTLSGATSLLSSVNSGAAILGWVEYIDRVIFETGGTPRYIESSGNAQTLDHVPPTGAITAADGGAGNLSGTYTWKYTYATSDNKETTAVTTASNSLNLTSKQASLTGVTVSSDAKVTKRFVYRTGGNLPEYYQVGEISDNTTTTFTDNKSDTTVLADGILLIADNTRIGASANVKYPEVFFDRIFWVNAANTNQLIWSKPLNPFAYPAANFIDFPSANIYKPTRFLDTLLIFADDTIYKLEGNVEEDFVMSRTLSSVGTRWPYTIVKMKDRLVFLNERGLWYFDGLTSRLLTNRLDPFFTGLTKASNSPFETDNSTASKFQAVVVGEDYYLAYAEDGQTENNRILKIELDTGRISKLNYGALSLGVDNQNRSLYMGDTSGFIYQLESGTDAGAGASVSFTFQTKFFDPAPGIAKHFQAITLDIDTDGLTVTPTALYDVGDSSETLSAFSTSSRDKKILRLDAAGARKARNISVRLSETVSRVKKSGSEVPAIRLFQIRFYYEPLPRRLVFA